jgi:hypothetical protein
MKMLRKVFIKIGFGSKDKIMLFGSIRMQRRYFFHKKNTNSIKNDNQHNPILVFMNSSIQAETEQIQPTEVRYSNKSLILFRI